MSFSFLIGSRLGCLSNRCGCDLKKNRSRPVFFLTGQCQCQIVIRLYDRGSRTVALPHTNFCDCGLFFGCCRVQQTHCRTHSYGRVLTVTLSYSAFSRPFYDMGVRYGRIPLRPVSTTVIGSRCGALPHGDGSAWGDIIRCLRLRPFILGFVSSIAAHVEPLRHSDRGKDLTCVGKGVNSLASVTRRTVRQNSEWITSTHLPISDLSPLRRRGTLLSIIPSP